MLKPKSATSCRDLPFFEVLHEANLDPARDTGTYFTAKEEACIRGSVIAGLKRDEERVARWQPKLCAKLLEHQLTRPGNPRTRAFLSRFHHERIAFCRLKPIGDALIRRRSHRPFIQRRPERWVARVSPFLLEIS